jgi:hypothetical protein
VSARPATRLAAAALAAAAGQPRADAKHGRQLLYAPCRQHL